MCGERKGLAPPDAGTPARPSTRNLAASARRPAHPRNRAQRPDAPGCADERAARRGTTVSARRRHAHRSRSRSRPRRHGSRPPGLLRSTPCARAHTAARTPHSPRLKIGARRRPRLVVRDHLRVQQRESREADRARGRCWQWPGQRRADDTAPRARTASGRRHRSRLQSDSAGSSEGGATRGTARARGVTRGHAQARGHTRDARARAGHAEHAGRPSAARQSRRSRLSSRMARSSACYESDLKDYSLQHHAGTHTHTRTHAREVKALRQNAVVRRRGGSPPARTRLAPVRTGDDAAHRSPFSNLPRPERRERR